MEERRRRKLKSKVIRNSKINALRELQSATGEELSA